VSDPIQAAAGNHFDVVLEATPTAGYAWEPRIPPESAGFVEYVGSTWMRPSPETIGGNALQQLTFHAIKPGDVTLLFVYRRPWEAVEQERRTVRVRVQ